MWWLYVLIGIAILITGFVILSITQAKKASIKLDEETFRLAMRKGQLIDVRSKKEFQEGHIIGARNISINILMRSFSQLRKDKPIYLYCNNGKLSQRAAVILRANGYFEIYQLDKGLKNWHGPLK